MKSPFHPRNDELLNDSGNASINDVIDQVDPSRRRFIGTGLGAATLASVGGLTLSGIVAAVEAVPRTAGFNPCSLPGIGFAGIPPALLPLPDEVRVPAGYTVQLLQAWGDPIMPGAPAFVGDASESSADQEKQVGMNTDGMHFFPFTGRDGKPSSERGILCVNHEYTQENLLHVGGLLGGEGVTIEKARKSQAAHGVSIQEVRKIGGHWRVLPNSPYGRRITGNTRMRIAGPAAGHPLMKSKAYDITRTATVDTGELSDGFTAFGTLNNCAHGYTPWGTFLTCEENFHQYFSSASRGAVVPPEFEFAQPVVASSVLRYGVPVAAGRQWATVDERFSVDANPLEQHHFGWVVEIDPFNPQSTPVKRTALGRFKHESAQYVVDDASDLAFYQGDDQVNEYIYKFVCAGKYNPKNRASNRDLLDTGVLYVARFNDDLTGQWLPLTPDSLDVNGVALRDLPRFAGADDAEVLAKILIQTRQAADAVGATMMDRPEWVGARPRSRNFQDIEVYCTLTNNSRRGTNPPSVNNPDGTTAAGAARPPVDAVNPRENNIYGHIIRWREDGRSVRATTFTWEIFVQCGDSQTTFTPLPTNDFKGNIVAEPPGSADYGAPDGLWFDDYGRMWVQTDQSGTGTGDWINIGANCMVCADPDTGLTRRFLTGPPRCEVTGVHITPDGKTMFVGIQHPGDNGTAANPTLSSAWPASQFSVRSDGMTPVVPGRPRSGVVVITKDDGGIIGT
jgi:secreted PhoX family phosphatase